MTARVRRFVRNELIILGLAVLLLARPVAAGGHKVIRLAVLRVRTDHHMDAGKLDRRLLWGEKIVIECQALGGKGGHSNVWDKISYPVKGWIPDWYTNSGGNGSFTKGIPRCGAKPKPSTAQQKAAAWARAQVGKTRQSNGLWWALWCDRFAANSYGRPYSGYVNAEAHYRDLRRRGLMRPDGHPAVGALVFYPSRLGGHVAIYVGKGQIVTTPAKLGQPVYLAGLHHFQGYRGWSYANPEWLRR